MTSTRVRTGVRVGHALGHTVPVAGGLTLMLLALYSGGMWTTRVPVAVFCASGLVFPSLRKSPWFWMPIALVVAVTILPHVYTKDNHKVLMALWCLAMLGATLLDDPDALGSMARWMIGLTFLFATMWKVVSPDFMNGAFIEFTLLTDSRFREFTAWLTAFPPELDMANHAALAELASTIRYGPPEALAESAVMSHFPKIRTVAVAITWYTVILEGCIALCFLASRRVSVCWRARNVLCLVFLLTTYAVATVIGFGWLIAIMGFAQCDRRERRSRAAFVCAFFVLQLFLVPWSSVFSELVHSITDSDATQ